MHELSTFVQLTSKVTNIYGRITKDLTKKNKITGMLKNEIGNS
jgi:hypothetical protein